MKHLNYRQIRALIKKDILVRMRQPWMTLLAIIWPCAIFMSTYILRLRFQSQQIESCQFPTRQLPTNDLLPFFQSYICTIENECSSVNKYEEVIDFKKAPVTPVVNIVQTFLNEKDLYNTVVELPKTMEFIGLVTKLATHPKFKYIESNADYLVKNLPEIRKTIGDAFDVNKLFSNDRIFSNLGKILCGKPFPRNNNIRYVNNILYSPDYNGADKDELDVMPTPYCKQLYLDVTNSNNGKITWKILKPIIQGKIVYGPINDETKEIMIHANKTMQDMGRLREFFRSIETSIKMLKTNKEFRLKFDNLLNLAKSSFVKALLGDSVDIETIEMVLEGLINDNQVLDIVTTIGNIFDCYNTNRFIGVTSEEELENVAFELAKKKLFFAAIYFSSNDKTNETTYKLRMEVDNTPVTVENRNRFWFPGPEANFELEMRYHRGFIELQSAIDVGIIRAKKKKQFEAMNKFDEGLDFSDIEFDDDIIDKNINNNFDDDETFNESKVEDSTKFIGLSLDDLSTSESNGTDSTIKNKISTKTATTTTSIPINYTEIFNTFQNKINISESDVKKFSDNLYDDDWNFDENDETTTHSSKSREKRQLEAILSMLGIGTTSKKRNQKELNYEVDKLSFFTKQFPYPKHIRDDFKKGLYLAQAIQISFFFALIILISSSVRQKIWFKESGNFMLMRTMGMRESSELISWIITTFFELSIVFFICLVILYSGGIMQYANKLLIYIFLLIFGVCVISFCYMSSSFFSTASIGSVSTVILFLMTFLPYIIIISLGATLSAFGKIMASISLSTAFCYAWHYIFRTELQERSLSFSNAFDDQVNSDNDFKFGIFMIIFDTILYAAIGYFYQRFLSNDNRFINIERRNLDNNFGAQMKKVSKTYEGCLKPAVDNVTINFKKNEILMLLGRNGAGKSTVIKMLTGQIAPSFGDISLPLDYDLISGIKNDQEQIGLCPQNNVLIPDLTALEHLVLYAHIKLRKDHRKEIRRVLNNLKLGKYKNFRVNELSGGYKRRLCIAIAFLGSPNLVILDEPCSSIDVNTRKNIWDLIETLRKNRAVVMSTHDLEEAQHLGDQIIMMKDGRIAFCKTTKDLHEELTKNCTLTIKLKTPSDKELVNGVKGVIINNCKYEANICLKEDLLTTVLPYVDDEQNKIDHANLFRAIENLQTDSKITNFHITSKTLDSYYKSIEDDINLKNGHLNRNYNQNNNNNHFQSVDLRNGKKATSQDFKKEISTKEIVLNLVNKRFLHFKRNYRLLICILVLPVIFQVVAMGFMKIRPPGDYDQMVEFDRASMYPNSIEFYSKENSFTFGEEIYDDFLRTCSLDENCEFFNNSKESFKWILKSHADFLQKRYGGISLNGSRSIVWYNNKGYHSMPIYLNQLDSAILRKELNDSTYNIRTINHPLKLGEKELSVSSILQNVADAGISLILLISFALVIAGASVYIVNERVSGEKLQQKLCGINFHTYWGVAYAWDFVIYCIAIVCAVIVFETFNIPIYVQEENLTGIILLLLLFGFAMVPGVHLFEKFFSEASFANMSIFCLNVVIPLTTMSVIILFDVLADTDEQERARYLLNRIFLIFPQHALADGLIEICKNHLTAKIFERYYINTYKSPINSDLLQPHFIALVLHGLIFIIVNYFVESGVFWRMYKVSGIASIKLSKDTPSGSNNELKVITIQNTLTKDSKRNELNYVLRAENLYKSYGGNQVAVDNVSFMVKRGECFSLLGINGAGKSTIFSIISGETKQFSGRVKLAKDIKRNSISYCPQANALDPLLTVKEIIDFYGKLRNVRDIPKLGENLLDNFHLKPYRDVLVKNLSGGNRRKLSVAIASIGNLSLVLMDEPVADMDPLTRHLVYKTIQELNEANCSVILTSHSIAEVEDVSHSIGIMVDGILVASGSPENLKKEFGNHYVVTLLSQNPLNYQFEAELRKTFRSLKNLICHQYSAQFLVQVRDYDKVDHCHMKISELVELLNTFTSSVKDLKFTISACMIDHVYENIIRKGVLGVDNNGFVQNENNH